MNEERVLQTMPVGMGRIERSGYTAYWVCVPKMRKPVSTRVARIAAYQKAKKRRQMLKKALEYAYAGVCLGCIVFMTITMANMAGMLPF